MSSAGMLDWLDRARDPAQADVLTQAVEAEWRRNRQEGLQLLKALYFQPETASATRRSLGRLMAQSQDRQLFNLVLGHYMLKGSLDPLTLVATLGDFADPSAVPALTSAWADADWPERAAIVDALSHMPAPETIDFFNQVFHGTLEHSGTPDPLWEAKIKRRVGVALSRFLLGH